MNLFGFGHQSLKQGLHRPRLAFARTLPKDGGGFLRSSLFQQRRVEAFLEAQTAAGDPDRIAGLSGLPAVAISRFELCLRIALLTGLQSGVICHFAAPFAGKQEWEKEFEMYPGCPGG